jgi:hypothetical protein
LALTFEPDSELCEIEAEAFSDLPILESLRFPASVSVIAGSAFWRTGISKLTFDDGNSHFRVFNNFLIDSAGITLIRSFD